MPPGDRDRAPRGIAERRARDPDRRWDLDWETTVDAYISDLVELATLRPRFWYEWDFMSYRMALAPQGAGFHLLPRPPEDPETGWLTDHVYTWPDDGVFPLLVCQLLSAVTAPGNLYRCDGCGGLHERQRAPRTNHRNYRAPCAEEARKERNKEYKKAGRERKRAPAATAAPADERG